MEVKYANYNKELGARNIDLHLYQILCKIIFDKYRIDFYNNAEQYNRIINAVNEMKTSTSFNPDEIYLEIPKLMPGTEVELSIPINYFNHKIEESDFMKDLLNKLIYSVLLYINNNIDIKTIKPMKLIFCGQTTRIPIITTLIKEYLTNKSTLLFEHIKYEIDCKTSLSEGLLYYNETLHGQWDYNIIINNINNNNNSNNSNYNTRNKSLLMYEDYYEESIFNNNIIENENDDSENEDNINYNYIYTIQLIEKDLSEQDKLTNDIRKMKNLIEATVYERQREIDKINDENNKLEMVTYLNNVLQWLKNNKYFSQNELKLKLDEMEDKWYSNAVPYISLKRSRGYDDDSDNKSVSSDEEKDYKKKNQNDSKRLKIIWFSKK